MTDFFLHKSFYIWFEKITFGEKAFYGKTNRFFIPVVLNTKLARLKSFKNTAVPEQDLKALAFVVDAFELKRLL